MCCRKWIVRDVGGYDLMGGRVFAPDSRCSFEINTGEGAADSGVGLECRTGLDAVEDFLLPSCLA